MFVITGGGSGIGKMLATALLERGEDVLIVGRDLTRLKSLQADYPQLDYFQADLSCMEGLAALVEYCQKYSSLKGLINNAGTIEPIAPLLDVSLSSWNKAMAINLNAPFFLTQQLYPLLKKGRVLNIGSGAAYFVIEGWAAYCSSKAALSMLTRCWQEEYPEFAIASVMPGIVDTDMQAFIRQCSGMSADKQAFYLRLKQENKLIKPETVASFLSWLLLDTNAAEFRSCEWDIYETWHYPQWLQPGQQVAPLEEGE